MAPKPVYGPRATLLIVEPDQLELKAGASGREVKLYDMSQACPDRLESTAEKLMTGANAVGVMDIVRDEDSDRVKLYVQPMSTTLAERDARMQDTLPYCETISGQVQSGSGQMAAGMSSNLAKVAEMTSNTDSLASR
ncbi:unnamed protein product [Zymoseptoria tritici ST99CH_3D7]|uniref:Uncharacterized protein n=1 Tax=Zymoseptoria tritici (strain ST99CH_3D7) TaxID=1276538 RepID=A0A1X7RZJ0_ZYMT9|nr:unnamed protein product [Zymoseptoria tritici ST99CH_3D7]